MVDKVKDAITAETTIKTNLITIIATISVIVAAFVSYTVAVNRIGNNEKNISVLNDRVNKLEINNVNNHDLLIQIQADVSNIKKNTQAQ